MKITKKTCGNCTFEVDKVCTVVGPQEGEDEAMYKKMFAVTKGQPRCAWWHRDQSLGPNLRSNGNDHPIPTT